MRIRLLQWNILYKENARKVANVIKKLNPDIACLQEVNKHSEANNYMDVPKFLGETLGYKYFYKPSMKYRNRKRFEFSGNAIYSKFPILDTRCVKIQEPSGTQDYDKLKRIYIEALINLGKKKMTVGTVHASYAHEFKATPEKIKEIKKLFAAIRSKKKNFVITGDFNCTPNSYVIREMAKRLIHCGPAFKQKTWTTKPFRYKGFYEKDLRWRLDYAFATKDIKIIKSTIVKTSVSDHLPILIEMDV